MRLFRRNRDISIGRNHIPDHNRKTRDYKKKKGIRIVIFPCNCEKSLHTLIRFLLIVHYFEGSLIFFRDRFETSSIDGNSDIFSLIELVSSLPQRVVSERNHPSFLRSESDNTQSSIWWKWRKYRSTRTITPIRKQNDVYRMFCTRIEHLYELERARYITPAIHLCGTKRMNERSSAIRIGTHGKYDARMASVADHRGFSRDRSFYEFFREVETAHHHTRFLGRNILDSHARGSIEYPECLFLFRWFWCEKYEKNKSSHS